MAIQINRQSKLERTKLALIDDSDVLDQLRRGPTTSTAAARVLGISRQAAHARLKTLVGSGRVVQKSVARATRYRLPAAERWEQSFPLAGLAEDRVLQQMVAEDAAIGRLTGEAEGLVAYVATELVNNAIDHSGGDQVRVSAEQRGTLLLLEIEDDGVGAFAHVRDALSLPSELSAIQEISKGKTTTDAEHHEGEGLFFTSKAVELFSPSK